MDINKCFAGNILNSSLQMRYSLHSTLYEVEPFCFTLPDVLVMMMVILIGSIT